MFVFLTYVFYIYNKKEAAIISGLLVLLVASSAYLVMQIELDLSVMTCVNEYVDAGISRKEAGEVCSNN